MDAPEPKPKERQRGIGPTCRGCGGPMYSSTTSRLPDGGYQSYYYCRNKGCTKRDSCKAIKPATVFQREDDRDILGEP